MRVLLLVPSIVISVAPFVGCISSTDDSGVPGDEIDCTGLVCDWAPREGTPRFGPTWHDGDLGVDLSDSGRQVIELRDVFFLNHDTRQLALRAVALRDPSASLSFELDFYAPGPGASGTFWDKMPIFLVTRSVDVLQQGVFSFHRQVLLPSESAAVVLRVVKDGEGRVMLDEVTLGH
jgi:hypothetical protein